MQWWGEEKAPPPSMAATGKSNPFRGSPFRYENVRDKVHVIVHDNDLWRDFKSELDRSGVKTGVGVKMVLLKFVTQRVPGDEATTRATIEALWQRKKYEDQLASGKMRNALSTPSLVDLAAGFGAGFGKGRRRPSQASTSGGGGQRHRRKGSFGHMSFQSAQSMPVVAANHDPPPAAGGAMKRVGSVGSFSALVDIPSKIFGGGAGDADDESAVTFGNISSASMAIEAANADAAAAAAAGSAAGGRQGSTGERRRSGFGRRRSRGSGVISLGSIGLRLEQETERGEEPQQRENGGGGKDAGALPPGEEEDMAKAAAIVAAMDLDEDLSSDSDDNGSPGNDAYDDGDSEENHNIDDEEIRAAAASISHLDLEENSTSDAVGPASCGPPGRHSFMVGYLNDLSDDDIVHTEARSLPPPAPPVAALQQPQIGHLNDLSGDDNSPSDAPPQQPDEIDPDELQGSGGMFRRSSIQRRMSFGTLSVASLGTMSVADITIEEDLAEDLSSHDEAEGDGDEVNDLGEGVHQGDEAQGERGGGVRGGTVGGIGIECSTVRCPSQFGEVSEYCADSSLWDGAMSSEYGDMGDDFEHRAREEQVQTGYIDGEGNVNADLGKPQKPAAQGGCQPAAEGYIEDEDEDDNDFILSFPSPEERAVIRRASQELISNSDKEEERKAGDESDDDDDGNSIHFPSPEERANRRRASLLAAEGKAEEDVSDSDDDYDGNASAQTWSGWSTGTDDDSLGELVTQEMAEGGTAANQGGAKLFDGHKSEASLWGRRERENGGRGGGLGWFGFRGRDAAARGSAKGSAKNDDTDEQGRGSGDHRRRNGRGNRNDRRRGQGRRHRAQTRSNNMPEEIKKIITRNQRK